MAARLQNRGFVTMYDKIGSFNVYYLTPLANRALELFDSESGFSGSKISRGGAENVVTHERVTHDRSAHQNSHSLDGYVRDLRKLRPHAYQFTYLLTKPLNQIQLDRILSFRDYPVKANPLKNHTDAVIFFVNLTAIVRTRTMTITGLELPEYPPEISTESAELDFIHKILSENIERIEGVIRRVVHEFRVERAGRRIFSGKVLGKEWAYEHHPAAELAVADRRTVVVKDFDGKVRYTVDRSNGYPEAECKHPIKATADMDIFRGLVCEEQFEALERRVRSIEKKRQVGEGR